MAKAKKGKKVHKQKLNPLVRMALERELKKRVESPEEREKIMMAFAGLDMKTLINDPAALALAASDPAGQLRNFVKDGIDPDKDLQDAESVDEAEGETEFEEDADDTDDADGTEECCEDDSASETERL